MKKELKKMGASEPMAQWLSDVIKASKKVYKVVWEHYRYGNKEDNEDEIVVMEHNETKPTNDFEKAKQAYYTIKKRSHYKGYNRYISIAVSSDNGVTYTGTYFGTKF